MILRNRGDISKAIDYITGLDLSDPQELTVSPYKPKRTLSQNALFHSWMGELSKYLISHGRKDWTPSKCKDGMKHTYLGYEEIERVNMQTGEVTVSMELRHTSDLDVGEMYYFMSLVEQWARNIGCLLTIPEKCEYMELKSKETE